MKICCVRVRPRRGDDPPTARVPSRSVLRRPAARRHPAILPERLGESRLPGGAARSPGGVLPRGYSKCEPSIRKARPEDRGSARSTRAGPGRRRGPAIAGARRSDAGNRHSSDAPARRQRTARSSAATTASRAGQSARSSGRARRPRGLPISASSERRPPSVLAARWRRTPPAPPCPAPALQRCAAGVALRRAAGSAQLPIRPVRLGHRPRMAIDVHGSPRVPACEGPGRAGRFPSRSRRPAPPRPPRRRRRQGGDDRRATTKCRGA